MYEWIWLISTIVFGVLFLFDVTQLMHNGKAAELGELPEQEGKDASSQWDLFQWGWGVLIEKPVWSRQKNLALRTICWALWLLPRVLLLYCVSHVRLPHMDYSDDDFDVFSIWPLLALLWVIVQQRMQGFTAGYKAGFRSAYKRHASGEQEYSETGDE